MALELLNSQMIQVIDGKGLDWKEAIRKAANPLVKNGTIGMDYVESMIQVVTDKGPYINIGPEIALAHSRPQGSVTKVGLSLMKTNQPINLVSAEHPVKLWFVLAAVDSTSHLSVIQELSQLLMNKENLKQLLEAETVDDILDVLNVQEG
ncbi:PTS sugar transporter subunit IIA [Lactobacillus sp. 3B(2020)]|uniref:PTS sugar transporter subunit IIA n=1 Tax=Lactobacillus sp. 3B(2020) TaxID=2695882 RepID=UPI0015DD9568|nr:PTS sugar transporter subunit IIA [Lactobacillus sp. 3B(2020)]QLL70570.1 PTS transporter subunit EIIA [Lactobacillus sp. 3B(2020)]